MFIRRVLFCIQAMVSALKLYSDNLLCMDLCGLPSDQARSLLGQTVCANAYYLIYKAESVCLSVCVCSLCVRTFLALSPSVVAEGTGGQVVAGLTLPVWRLPERYLSISDFFFMDDHHFLINFRFYRTYSL